jgi:hypothetical protein
MISDGLLKLHVAHLTWVVLGVADVGPLCHFAMLPGWVGAPLHSCQDQFKGWIQFQILGSKFPDIEIIKNSDMQVLFNIYKASICPRKMDETPESYYTFSRLPY